MVTSRSKPRSPAAELLYKLEPAGALRPPGMVRVVGGPVGVGATQMTLGDFWMDAREVTNKQFKAFVDAGGYADAQILAGPVRRTSGKHLDWEQATARLRDATGRPGPAGWELGAYTDGQARPAGRGSELVRGGSVRSVCGKGASDNATIGRRAADFRIVFRHPRPSATSPVKVPSRLVRLDGVGAFGYLRHGRQRQGMVLERIRQAQAVHPRRRVE